MTVACWKQLRVLYSTLFHRSHVCQYGSCFISLWGNCQSAAICGLRWLEVLKQNVGFSHLPTYQNQHLLGKKNQHNKQQNQTVSQRSLAHKWQLKCCSTIAIASEWLLSFHFILSWLVPRLNCFQMNKTPSICVFASVRKKKNKSTYCDKRDWFHLCGLLFWGTQ